MLSSHWFQISTCAPPYIAVLNAYVEEEEFQTLSAQLAKTPPWYCNNKTTDHVFSTKWQYVDNGKRRRCKLNTSA